MEALTENIVILMFPKNVYVYASQHHFVVEHSHKRIEYQCLVQVKAFLLHLQFTLRQYKIGTVVLNSKIIILVFNKMYPCEHSKIINYGHERITLYSCIKGPQASTCKSSNGAIVSL